MLVNADFCPLAQQIVDYLIDAGHRVYALDTSLREEQRWRCRAERNFAVVEAGELSGLDLDYEIIFSSGSGLLAIDRLVLELREADKEIVTCCYLQSPERGEALLRQDRRKVARSVEAIRDVLLETCIDCIIALSRGDRQNLLFVPTQERVNELSVFSELECAVDRLVRKAREVIAGEDYCAVEDLLCCGSRNVGTGTLEYVLNDYRIAFTASELEWLGLWLQLLLNSRKSGVYGYELCTHEGRIRKYVDVSTELRRADLDDSLSDVAYQVRTNKLYDFDATFAEMPPPGMVISWDAPTIEAPLVLSFDSATRVLRVACPVELPLLGCLREHLDAFVTRLPEFARGGLDLGELTQLPKSLQRRYCDEFNRTEQLYPDEPIHCLIGRWARRTPDATALVCQERSLSYREIEESADRLACVLCKHHQVRAGDLVALYLDRTEHLPVSMLAVLKLGCAYVPLDLDWPINRIATILSSSQPKLVLSDEANQDALARLGPSLAVDSARTRELIDAEPAGNLRVTVSANELAYVIYTSGTTGNPKGVAVEHRNFVNVATDFGRCLNFRTEDRMLAVTTIAFDISMLEIFLPLMHGGTVVLAARGDLREIDKLLFLIDRVGITVAQATPSLWQLIVQKLGGKRLPIKALCGGEALPFQLARALARSVDTCWNVYGPTETTVWSTRQRVTGNQAQVTIGVPLANTRCYVLDEWMRPVPPGVVGELFIGGAGVARGYFGEPELTGRKFVADPVTGGPDRVFRTGDLVRQLPGGELVFIGRNDFQIKLRGHRIELGEVESALVACPGVEQSLVVVRESAAVGTDNESRFLVGYYVAAKPVDNEQLRTYLAAVLPDYMVPTVLIHLTELPLNLNGKVDRNALPHPELFRTQGYVAPSTELESRLCPLWEEVLGRGGQRRGIGVLDNFFDLGGNSLLGIKLINKINSELGSDIKIRDLFRHKTVRGLAPLVAGSVGSFAYDEFVLEGVDRERLYEPFPLSNVQQAYFLGRFNNFELSDVSTHVYSEFRYSDVDHHRLEVAFNRLIDRHLSLRTEFADGHQRFLREIPPYRIESYKLRTEGELHRLRERYSHKVYDPECYPLFDVVLSRLDRVHRLHISFDAIVIDMTSFQILFAEWAQLYHDPELHLPELCVTYRDYVLRYEEVRNSNLLSAAREYWESKADAYILDLNLPLRAHPSTIDKPRFKRRSKLIAAPVWRLLGTKCKRYGLSATALILELYSQVLSRWSGQDRLTVNLTLFNRLPLHPDVNAIIGDFTVLELFDYRADRELSIAAKLRRVHDELLQDIDNNLFDGVDFQRLLKMRKSIPINRIVAPVVLTSTLGAGGSSGMFELLLGDCYEGVEYSISQTSQVWLDNKAYETEQGFVAEWDYVNQLFDESIIEVMHEAYCWLIERVAELDWEADGFPALRVPEADFALIAAANDYCQPPSEHTLISLYESRLIEPEFAQRTAVVEACGAQYSYERVHRDSDALARFLLDPNGPPTVGVLAEKGYLQVLSTTAIMKAGAAYVPINVEWPLIRIGEVLAQAGVYTVLVSRAQYERTQSRLPDNLRLLVIEDVLIALPAEGPLPEVTPDDVAYVIFTSGSTGKPKGVTISHRGAVNTILAANKRFGVMPGDRVLALSELSFDLSVYDIFGILAAGGTIVFPRQEDTKDPARWLDLVRRYGVTIWNSVPQLASLLVDEADEDAAALASLRVFMLSGDWIPTSLPNKIWASTPDATVMSLGGATEGSIWSIWYEVGEVDSTWASIPYGVAMPNQGMYVLNSHGEHCPVGVTGEIYIAGMGVALNYWQDAQLTAERYVLHPELGRLYRTGDLGRWSRDGYIEFLGRNDFQVKLNGYRVELGEIEAALTQLPGVDQAVVQIQQTQAHGNLVGYLVPSAAQGRLVEPGDPELDKQEFLRRSAGVRRDVMPSHQLHLRHDPDGYALAKSYRRFLNGEVDPTLLRKHFTEILNADTAPATRARLDRQGWSAVLGRLAAVFLPGRALPKYRFPSAGSAYPVRTYVTAAALSGRYYHDPLTHQLCVYDQRTVTGDADEIALAVHWPAIFPLYGHRARELALLEIGHMLSLIMQALGEQAVRGEVRTGEQRLDADNSVVCRIIVGRGSGRFTPQPLEFACFLRDAEAECYAEQSGNREYDLNQLPVFDRVNDVYAILREARCAVTLEGASNTENLVSAGFLFQRLCERLHADGLGTCMLGLPLTTRGLYTMVAGPVDRDALRAPEIQADRRNLARAVNEELAKVLPDYMLPGRYLALDELPLSANGKVALDQLPEVEVLDGYMPPSSTLERILANIWASVLGLDPKSISVTTSFFAIGGDSLSAVKLFQVIQRDLELDLKLRDLYQHDTIAKLADYIGRR